MNRLIPYRQESDILENYKNTPIEEFLEYHNLKKDFTKHQKARLLIAMCMDNRKYLNIPENFAYIIRTGGGNLRQSEFKVSYAIAIGGVETIAILAHNGCGMTNLFSRKDDFIRGLTEKAGWEKERAEEHFFQFSPLFEIGNEVDFVLSEAKRLRMRYPKILTAPLYYKIEENAIYQIGEK